MTSGPPKFVNTRLLPVPERPEPQLWRRHPRKPAGTWFQHQPTAERAQSGHPGKPVKELVFGSKNDRRAQNHASGICSRTASSPAGLGSRILAVDSVISANRRQVHHPRATPCSAEIRAIRSAPSACTASNSFLPKFVQNANTVYNSVRTLHRLGNRGIIANIAQKPARPDRQHHRV